MRPSAITSTRSQRSGSSSGSEEMTSTAMPCAARSRISRWISPRAPMSTPRVGSSRISTLGPRSSQRPITTFCWLPPLSRPTGVSTDGVLIASSRTVSSASDARRRPSIERQGGAVDDASEIGELQVEGDALGQQQSLGSPLLRHQAEPRLDGVDGRARREGPALQRHGPGIGAIGAIEEAGEFGPAGPDEAADAEHLAAPEVEADALDPGMAREAAYAQQTGALRRTGRGFGHPLDLTADDGLDERRPGQAGLVDARDRAPVPERGHAVAQAQHSRRAGATRRGWRRPIGRDPRRWRRASRPRWPTARRSARP